MRCVHYKMHYYSIKFYLLFTNFYDLIKIFKKTPKY